MERAQEAAVETEAPAAAEARRGGLDTLPGRILALQRTVGNAAVTRLLQRRDYSDEAIKHRRDVKTDASQRAQTYAGHRYQSESFELFDELLQEWYPAYFARKGIDFLWNTDFEQKEMLKVVDYHHVDKIWNETTDKPMLVIGPEFTKQLASESQVDYVVAELGRKLREIDDKVLDTPSKDGSGRRLIQVEAEQVFVASVAERNEAEKLVATLKSEYGIELSSIKSKESMRRKYPTMEDNPQLEEVVHIVPWELSELRALAGAAAFYAPILGDKRASSSRVKDSQEWTSAGKMSASAVWVPSKQKHEADPTTFAEAYYGLGTVTFHGAGTNAQKDWPGNPVKQRLGTAVHELSHLLLRYAVTDFLKAMPYWKNEGETSGKRGVEAPPTDYGATGGHVSEDLCESVMLFFVDPERLKKGVPGKRKGEPGNPCPERFRFVEKLVAGWKKK